jgi:hypothetical protein
MWNKIDMQCLMSSPLCGQAGDPICCVFWCNHFKQKRPRRSEWYLQYDGFL